MSPLASEAGEYRSIPGRTGRWSRWFPSLAFYSRLWAIILSAARRAKRGEYDDEAWVRSSLEVLRRLEAVGVRFDITGLEHVARVGVPCIVVGNHMSTLETFVLPSFLRPYRKVTFVVKENLTTYPVFRHVMRSRHPIVVGRKNPRADLRSVLEGGAERLAEGVSVVVFPQTTRTVSFDPTEFNTIGVKLAQRTGAPVVPLALVTDAWGTGGIAKDFGRIDPARRVHFAFGEPVRVRGRGVEEHRSVVAFIQGKLRMWRGE